jgi:hypothetical protein
MTDVRGRHDGIMPILDKQTCDSGQDHIAAESMSIRRWHASQANLSP